MPNRNKTEGFAAGTRRNVDFILAAHQEHADVHVVTQVVLSLLGLVVFPFERIIKGSNHVWSLAELEAHGICSCSAGLPAVLEADRKHRWMTQPPG
jgi:hypothetical protein